MTYRHNRIIDWVWPRQGLGKDRDKNTRDQSRPRTKKDCFDVDKAARQLSQEETNVFSLAESQTENQAREAAQVPTCNLAGRSAARGGRKKGKV
jgi:hypothetical protein